MTNSTIPSIVSSVLLAMIAYKVYSNDESKKEHYVNYPTGLSKNKITMEVAGQSPVISETSILPSSEKVKETPIVPDNPLPRTDDGATPPVVIVDRVLKEGHAALQSRHRKNGDNIRGDLPIAPYVPCGLFGYTTLNKRGLHEGILGFGENNTTEKPKSYLSVRE